MLVFPEINPVALSIGPLHVHWYGLMYLFAFISAWLLAHWRVKHYRLDWTAEQISDLIFFAALGVIIGGRLGYMIFYKTAEFLAQPWVALKIWEGGMSFHGGLLGVFIAGILFARKFKKPFWQVADFAVPLVPLGLLAGRAGNFINGELWGRVTDAPWGMVFPRVDALPRHPSQLYELGLEGVVLFICVWWYAARPRPAGCVTGIFLMAYAVCRFIIECFREPDSQLGYLAFNWLTMGQLLSIPMLLVGLSLWWTRRNANIPTTH
ncbi:MAG TPA: prolipoprotein diacylglyceryl transferase [Legionella sp.]|nr:prolipoprotein diacylglyceryl transferase [Legionella sp.]